jgi:hypothetical protein
MAGLGFQIGIVELRGLQPGPEQWSLNVSVYSLSKPWFKDI